MQSINEIQSRLKGMEDIKHLLRSIRAMSAIRWRKAKQHLDIAKVYAESVDAQLGLVMASSGSRMLENLIGLKARRTGKIVVGLITLTSDRGLCGNFNSGLVSKAITVTEIINKKTKM